MMSHSSLPPETLANIAEYKRLSARWDELHEDGGVVDEIGEVFCDLMRVSNLITVQDWKEYHNG